MMLILYIFFVFKGKNIYAYDVNSLYHFLFTDLNNIQFQLEI